ncbi:MAG: hypothetical protein P8188_18980 [Gemmatimonadota bacterium]
MMIAEHRTVELRTHGNDHIVDITGDVQALVADTGVQQIVFMDFDTRPRRRTVHVSVMGVQGEDGGAASQAVSG